LAIGVATGIGGHGREVGELVVEQEAATGHVEGAEAGLDRGGHRDHVAVPSTTVIWVVPFSATAGAHPAP
jgi:hypothetical protein